jgi:tight adherence protein B
VVAFLLGGVVVVVWPIGLARRRWTMRATAPDRAPRSPASFIALHTVRALLIRHPRRTVAGTVIAAAVVGWTAAGPVAAAALGTYAGLAARTLLRRRQHREQAATRARALDELGALAADLRAGLPPADLVPADLAPPDLAPADLAPADLAPADLAPADLVPADFVPVELGSAHLASGNRPPVHLGPGGPGAAASSPVTAAPRSTPDDSRLRELTAAVWRLAERTGAPVADLVDRIEADGRAADRGRAAAAAHAAGARATALLLAGLPAGGIALGYAIGVDPLRVLFHTPLGAACVAGALVLQLGGLAWADRLAGAGAGR